MSTPDEIRSRIGAEIEEPFAGQSDGTPPSNPRGPDDEPCPTCDHYVSGCDHCNGPQQFGAGHPDEIIDQVAKALRGRPHDQPWPSFITPDIIKHHMMWATRLAEAGLLADRKHARRQWDAENDALAAHRRVDELEDDCKQLLWLHAEAVWKHDELAREIQRTTVGVKRHYAAERDERQARIDKALDMLGTGTVVQANGEDIRDALTGGAG